MAEIVGSLFGISPADVNREAMANESARAYQFANLTPAQQGQYGGYMAGQMLGRGVSGLLGAEDPRLVQAKQMQQVKNFIAQQGIDINTPEGLAQAAQYANSIGATEGAMYLGQQALQLRKQTTEVAKTEEDYTRENAFRAAVAALPPEQRTEENIMQLAAQYGTTSTVMSALANLTGKREAIAARQEAAAEKVLTKQQEKEDKIKASNQAALAAAMPVMDAIEKAIPLVGWNTAGWGSFMQYLPGTDAKDLANFIGTIKANLGFQQLQAMRQASPTGGALGQVAVKELEALQSTIASLDPAQKKETLTANLKKVQTHYLNWKKTLEQQLGQGSGVPSKEEWMKAARASKENAQYSDKELSDYYDKTHGGK